MELSLCARPIEPVEGLPGCDEIDRGVLQSRSFGTSIDAVISASIPQKLFAGLSHLRIRFDSENFIAIVEKQTREISRSGADVGNYRARRQFAARSQYVDHLRRISRSILYVIVNTIGEACKRIFCTHFEDL